MIIHLYVSLPDPEPPGAATLVEEILAHDADVGLVQTAAGGDEETMRRVAGSHIRACDGLVAISDGPLQPRQASPSSRRHRKRSPIRTGGDLPPGNGLRLTLAAEYVKAMGGSLDVESEPGRGPTFSFELPIARDGAAPGHHPRSAAGPPAGLSVPLLRD